MLPPRAAWAAVAACTAAAARQTGAASGVRDCDCAGSPGRPDWEAGTSSISGPQPATSAAACCALCGADDMCVAWTFAAESARCWLKENDAGGHAELGRVSGSCNSHPAPAPGAPAPAPVPQVVPVAVELDGAAPAVATVSDRFVSYTMDWWLPTEGASPEGWGPHANVLEVDLASPKLRLLAAALGPAVLRIGGSLDKEVIYDVPEAGGVACGSGSGAGAGDTNHASHVGGEGGVASKRGRGGGRGVNGGLVSGGGVVVGEGTNLHPSCLNASRWAAIHEFAAAADAQVVFGLSYPLSGDGTWNASQATALLRYSRAALNLSAHNTLFGFELGEELTQFKVGTPAFTAYTQGYHACAALLRDVWGDDPAGRPQLMGPCPGMSWPQLATWFPAFLNGTRGALDVAVYNQIEPFGPRRVLYLNTTIPSGNLSTQKSATPGGTGWQAAAMHSFAQAAGATPLWLGEFAGHNGGGGGTFASTFASSFGYLDTLGALARLNHSALARQTLVGGNYELLRCSSGQDTGPEPGAGCDFEPHPDYWVALLWRRLMSATVLQAPTATARHAAVAAVGVANESATAALRFHAHCTAGTANGSVTVAFSNMAEAATFNLSFAGASTAALAGRRVEYVLTAHDVENATAAFSSRQLELNARGVALHVGNAAPALPALPGRPRSAGDPLLLPPVSLGWAVFPDAGSPVCKRAVAE